MPFISASFSAISQDTGDGFRDFNTQDSSLILRGTAHGNGKLGVWLSDPNLGGGQPFLLDTIKIGPHDDPKWVLDLRSFDLPEGNFTLYLTNGGNQQSLNSPLATHSLVIDETKPIVTIDTVEGNDVLSAPETGDGLQVSGSATDADGEKVAVQVRDAFGNVLFAARGVISGGTWSVTFDPSQAATLTGTDYSIHARVEDDAGNIGKADHAFTSTVCFMAGTMIRTPDGEVAVEDLERGDLVITADGRSVPVTWLGVQTVSRLFADPNRVWPIRIKAGALADNVPSRDLLISPDHAILVDDVLVQAGALINGSSIVREGDVPATFTYFHVETEDHSLILAHDVPSETFVDNVNRMAFDNWSEHEALYPQGKSIVEMSYPRAQSMRQVPSVVRQRLSARSEELFTADITTAA